MSSRGAAAPPSTSRLPRLASGDGFWQGHRVLILDLVANIGLFRVFAARRWPTAWMRIAEIWHRDDGYGMFWAWRPS